MQLFPLLAARFVFIVHTAIENIFFWGVLFLYNNIHFLYSLDVFGHIYIVSKSNLFFIEKHL